jgi:hypothetical protein
MNAGEPDTRSGENGQMNADDAIRRSGQVPDRFQNGESAPDAEYQPDQYGSARADAEGKIDAAVDEYADKLPGGRNVADQAKQQISDALDHLESQAADTMGDQNGL